MLRKKISYSFLMMLKVRFFIQQWYFGTVNKDGSSTGAAGCNAANNPNYIINIPVSDIFYDPPIASIGYTSLAYPSPALFNAIVAIDLYEVQQVVLMSQPE